jgi:AAA domain
MTIMASTPPPSPGPREPDLAAIKTYADALFRYATPGGFVSLRAFPEGHGNSKAFRIRTMPWRGDSAALVKNLHAGAKQAANAKTAVVFCPPIATFRNPDHAGDRDLLEGLALSVECDREPSAARVRLERLLGPATLVVASGGIWTNGGTESEDKLHLHWRLKTPARGDALPKLKQLRRLATALVGGDATNISIAHPIRCPGSWHCKATPRLCTIVKATPDVELELDATLVLLTAATKPLQGTTDHANEPVDWSALLAAVLNSENYHEPLNRLAFNMITAGMQGGAAVNLLRGLMEQVSGPRDARWQARYDDIPRAVSTAQEKFSREDPATATPLPPLAQLYRPRPFSEIPPRAWLHAGHYIRRHLVATVAPGGWGKTTLTMLNAVEMRLHHGLIGPDPTEGPLCVCYWNAEDPAEEIERRLAAICLRYEIEPAELASGFYLGNRIFGQRLASLDRVGNIVFNERMFDALEQLISDARLDCVILDPFIKFHRLKENDNNTVEQLAERLSHVANQMNICIEVVPHTRKPPPGQHGELTAHDNRGAGALVDAARSVRVLNRMTVSEAELPNIDPEERQEYLRLSRGKPNMVRPEKARWLHLCSVTLPNATDTHPNDEVQTLETWEYPITDVTDDDAQWAREEVMRKNYRESRHSKNGWFGYALAKRLGLDASKPQTRKRLDEILQAWVRCGVLKVEPRKDPSQRKD